MATTVKAMLAAANEAVPKVDPDQAKAMVEKGEALVVDVRDPQEVAASGKVKGALNVPRGMLEFSADPALPSYCKSGGRSALAAATLQQMGFPDVAHLDGGVEGWRLAGRPVEPATP